MKHLLKGALRPTLSALDEKTESSLDVASGAYAGVDLTAQQLFTGLQGRLTPPRRPVQFAPSVEGSVLSDAERWQVNADVLFGTGPAPLASYAGAGLCLVGPPGDERTRVGLNLLGGATFTLGSIDVFIQVRLTVADGVHLSLTGGASPKHG
jgi:hypothetical protein